MVVDTIDEVEVLDSDVFVTDDFVPFFDIFVDSCFFIATIVVSTMGAIIDASLFVLFVVKVVVVLFVLLLNKLFNRLFSLVKAVIFSSNSRNRCSCSSLLCFANARERAAEARLSAKRFAFLYSFVPIGTEGSTPR